MQIRAFSHLFVSSFTQASLLSSSHRRAVTATVKQSRAPRIASSNCKCCAASRTICLHLPALHMLAADSSSLLPLLSETLLLHLPSVRTPTRTPLLSVISFPGIVRIPHARFPPWCTPHTHVRAAPPEHYALFNLHRRPPWNTVTRPQTAPHPPLPTAATTAVTAVTNNSYVRQIHDNVPPPTSAPPSYGLSTSGLESRPASSPPE
jgi:hypothetical protein